MAEPASFIEFNHALEQLVGKECWSVVAGEGTGSMVSLDFGRKQRRKTAVRNRHLTRTQREFEGEFDLFIQGCAWRLEEPRKVICSSMSDNANDGPMVAGLERLDEQKVLRVVIDYPGYDLALTFEGAEGELTLRLFCDQADREGEADNYSFFSPKMAWAVGPGSVLRKAARRAPPPRPSG